MSDYLWLVPALGLLTFMACRAAPIWLDCRWRSVPRRWYWTLAGIVAPSRYWWRARIEAMSPDEQADVLARETAKLGLSRADSLRCPLCGTDVPHAWTLDAEGRPMIAPGPVHCPQCDFRLDACRHCEHFLPGAPGALGGYALGGGDMSFGRCGQYKTPQSVDQVYSPEMAQRLKERGYEVLNAPIPIVDSFMPPDFCRAFQPQRKRLQVGGVRWPEARRAALLRLLAPSQSAGPSASEETASDAEQWLL